jgi:polyisoprenoid-binding protein YceI
MNQMTAASEQSSKAPFKSGSYTLESTHARVMFTVSHFGFSTWVGEFPLAEGSLELDMENLSSSRLRVTMSVAKVTTTNAVLDEELRSSEWLDCRRYPTMTFESTRVTLTGSGEAEIQGDFSLHGVTKKITLYARFNASGINPIRKTYTIGFEVAGSIKRSDFGVTHYVPMIGDDVRLMISAPFELKPAAALQ